jgi:DNA-binding transcriptional ArsR family regulator
MWFDVAAALQAVTAGGGNPSPVAAPPAKVAEVAEVAAPLAPNLDDEAAILAAICAGRQRPGAIASATKLGATRVYRLLDKMRDAGLIRVARDGRITTTPVS